MRHILKHDADAMHAVIWGGSDNPDWQAMLYGAAQADPIDDEARVPYTPPLYLPCPECGRPAKEGRADLCRYCDADPWEQEP